MDVAALLQGHPLFAGMEADALARAVRAGTAVTLAPGQVCIRQGEAGEVFGVLVSGRLEACRGAGAAEQIHLSWIEPGECFGETSLLTGNPSSADVVAAVESQAVVFLQEAIGPVLATHPAAVRLLTRQMAARLAPAVAGRDAAPRPAAVRYCLGASEPMRILSICCRREDIRYRYFDTTSERAFAGGMVVGLGGGGVAAGGAEKNSAAAGGGAEKVSDTPSGAGPCTEAGRQGCQTPFPPGGAGLGARRTGPAAASRQPPAASRPPTELPTPSSAAAPSGGGAEKVSDTPSAAGSGTEAGRQGCQTPFPPGDVGVGGAEKVSDTPSAAGPGTEAGRQGCQTPFPPGGAAVHKYWGPGGEGTEPVAGATHEAALAAVFAFLAGPKVPGLDAIGDLSAIGHRVCHGGLHFDGPAIVDERVKAEIRLLADLAPMENPYNVVGIETCEKLAPGVPQVAVFDTAFFLRLPEAASRYALPELLGDDPLLRRFGGHGISHEGAARAACGHLGLRLDAVKVVTVHLGSGASVAAIEHGRPVDCTMGFSPLAGLVMATRSGDVDPALILHLVARRGLPPGKLEEQLYSQAGLLGLSGVSGDLLTVKAAADGGQPRALVAMQAYCRQARKAVAAYVGLMGGADVLVFTGGVGENEFGVRARICQGLAAMGIQLDDPRNRAARVRLGEVAEISPPDALARVLVVGSNEEHTIACQAVRALSARRVDEVIRRSPRPIPIGPSAHHVHLTQADCETLFGAGHQLTWHADLSQPGQFACKEQVTLVGPKGRIERVRVLGPVRKQSQVEIARTEEFKLGIDAPVRMSGDLAGSPGIILEGPAGALHLAEGVICAHRHIHMSPADALAFAVRDRDVVRIRVEGERELIFGDVAVRVSPDYRLDMHIDTDEANAAELSAGAVGYLDSIQQRAGA